MDFLAYLLKVNIAIILFYGFYRLLSQQDTFFRWRRGVLFTLVFIAILYPFVDMTRQFMQNHHWQEAVQNGVLPVYSLPEIVVFGQATGQTVSFVHYLPQLLLALYGVVAVVLFVRLLVQTGMIIRMVHHAQTMKLYGTTIRQHPGMKTPFSFFRWIVLDTALYTDVELREILRHEETHVREVHSVDILLAEVFCVCCWFNPFAWLLKREIRMNLEFLADRSVLASGYEAEHYQFHLLRLTYHKAAAKIVNNFNVSLLKKRIFMMNKKQTSKLSIFKYTLLIPVVAALVFFNSTFKMQAGIVATSDTDEIAGVVLSVDKHDTPAVQDTVILPPTKGKIVSVSRVEKTEPAKAQPDDKNIFSHVETMPLFPGGEKAMMQWLGENIKYPLSAVESHIEGRVLVRFVITSDGSIKDVTLLRALEPACDQEAIRVIEGMPKWEPGMQSGKAVSVYYTLPILFRLTENDKTSQSNEKTTSITLTDTKISDNVVIEVEGKVISSSELSAIDPQTIQTIEVFKDEKTNTIKITLKK